MKRLFTSESVTEGHPDKICDQISDAVLDAILSKDPNARVACETCTTTGLVMVMGEITTNCYVDIPKVVRETIREIGYDRAKYGFDCDTCAVMTTIDEQSADIAMGVDEALESKKGDKDDVEAVGAGDQGMMFGFATNETPEFMPLPIAMAHRLSRRLTEVRKNGTLDYLRPDGKTQVTVEYENNTAKRIDAIVISTQHGEEVTLEQIEKDLMEYVIREVVPAELLDENTKYYINPTGRFVVGGPQGDSGLDPTKVDRSAAYAARWVAKNLVAAGLADKLEIQLAYAIGVAKPVSIEVETFGTGKVDEQTIINIVEKVFDLRPGAIIKELDLRRPIYKQTAAYGHFGRTDLNLPWEQLNKVEEIKNLL